LVGLRRAEVVRKVILLETWVQPEGGRARF